MNSAILPKVTAPSGGLEVRDVDEGSGDPTERSCPTVSGVGVPFVEQVLAELNEPVQVPTVAARLGTYPQKVHYAVTRLVADGRVRSWRNGRSVFYVVQGIDVAAPTQLRKRLSKLAARVLSALPEGWTSMAAIAAHLGREHGAKYSTMILRELVERGYAERGGTRYRVLVRLTPAGAASPDRTRCERVPEVGIEALADEVTAKLVVALADMGGEADGRVVPIAAGVDHSWSTSYLASSMVSRGLIERAQPASHNRMAWRLTEAGRAVVAAARDLGIASEPDNLALASYRQPFGSARARVLQFLSSVSRPTALDEIRKVVTRSWRSWETRTCVEDLCAAGFAAKSAAGYAITPTGVLAAAAHAKRKQQAACGGEARPAAGARGLGN